MISAERLGSVQMKRTRLFTTWQQGDTCRQTPTDDVRRRVWLTAKFLFTFAFL